MKLEWRQIGEGYVSNLGKIEFQIWRLALYDLDNNYQLGIRFSGYGSLYTDYDSIDDAKDAAEEFLRRFQIGDE